MDARHARHTLCALALALPSGLALAQAAAPARADAEPRVQHIVVEDEGSRIEELRVQHIVVEDEGSRIEELRVRGATQRITVQPKVGTTKSYEIITGDGSRDLGEGVNTSRGAAGKRVWNVLKF